MTGIWSAFVELLQMAIFGVTQLYGGSLGWAIVTVGVVARLLLLPLTVSLALRARSHARRLAALKPALQRVRERWASDPRRMLVETATVYERAGVRPIESSVVRGSLVQAPLFMGLFQAIRAAVASPFGSHGFLWLSSLVRPSIGVALVGSLLAGLGSMGMATTGNQNSWMLVLTAVLTFVLLVNVSAGFGLYMTTSGLTGLLQTLIVRHIEARQARVPEAL